MEKSVHTQKGKKIKTQSNWTKETSKTNADCEKGRMIEWMKKRTFCKFVFFFFYCPLQTQHNVVPVQLSPFRFLSRDFSFTQLHHVSICTSSFSILSLVSILARFRYQNSKNRRQNQISEILDFVFKEQITVVAPWSVSIPGHSTLQSAFDFGLLSILLGIFVGL